MKEHVPVLLNEFLEFFDGLKIRFFFDGTLGAGGHAGALLEAHPEVELFIGCDRDIKALEIAKGKLKRWRDKLKLYQGNFKEVESYLGRLKIECLDGCFFDLGISSIQLEDASRGFSFQRCGSLDMRMDQTADITAQRVVNELPKAKLVEIFERYGDERKAGRIAHRICLERRKKRIKTTEELRKLIEEVVRRRGKIHPATKVFQALRIYVNDEMKNIEEGVSKAVELLCVGGRCGVITFHSGEDRIVKNLFKGESKIKLINEKPILPTRKEIENNPRSRSAKMRFVEKKE